MLTVRKAEPVALNVTLSRLKTCWSPHVPIQGDLSANVAEPSRPMSCRAARAADESLTAVWS